MISEVTLMNDNKAVFTKYEEKYVLMHIKGNRAENIYAYPSLDDMPIGTIINCRIEKQLDGMDSGFVMYDSKKQGFINKKIKCGTVMPLMYKKEAYDDKKPVFSDKLTIDGTYVVATDGESYVKASSKIDEERKKEYIDAVFEKAKELSIGVIIRTSVDNTKDGISLALDEMRKIKETFDAIRERSQHVPQYTVLYRPIPAFIKDILYLCGQGIEEIVTDDELIREKLEGGYETVTGPVSLTDRVRLRFYDDPLVNLCKLYSFNAKISEACGRRVYLKSGAYITIDHTEACTVIDVNSAKTDAKSVLAVNKEAAYESIRQLRLRGISGMILIDFINMQTSEEYDELEGIIKQAAASERIHTGFIDFTGLGIAELVRDRTGRELAAVLRSR